MMKKNKMNLLILGASGGVAAACLLELMKKREMFGKLFLLDKSETFLQNPYIDHKKLNYQFICKTLTFPESEVYYATFLESKKIDIVLDLTDMDSIPILTFTNTAGVSYVNTAMNDENRYVSDLVFDVYAHKKKFTNARHILCTGMNPGIVNMWVKYGIENFGVPKEVFHFEYDTSVIAAGWQPMMTWSLHEFIVELVTDPTGKMLGKNKLQRLLPNGLHHRVDMKAILSPIMQLDAYPKGFQVLHEENLSISQQYNIPSQFIYGFNMQTMDALVALYKKHKTIRYADLIHGDNTSYPLLGEDNIGVLLRYNDKNVYYFNSIANQSVIGTNGTYSQVIVGIFAALSVLLVNHELDNGVYFVEDLYKTYFKQYMFEHMKVEEYVFASKDNELLRYTSRIHPEIAPVSEQIFI